MKRWTVFCVVFGGCGFQGSALRDGGPGDDGTRGETSEAGADPPTDCWARWTTGNLEISPPRRLDSVSSDDDDRDPWISPDRLRLYFASNREDSHDIFRASRPTTTQPFGEVTRLANLSTDGEDDRASLTSDEKMLVLARGGADPADVYIITRNAVTEEFASPNTDRLDNINDGEADNYDPFLTTKGLAIYLAPDPPGAALQQLMVATRADHDGDFTTPVAVPGIAPDPARFDADPALSPDERIILFSSDRDNAAGVGDLWYATRQDPRQAFGVPARIPAVNSDDGDGDPMLSADGCELYFSSKRGGNLDLYTAQVTR